MKAILALFVGLVGLSMTTCGLFFTVPTIRSNDTSIMIIALPSIILGILAIWAAWKLWSWRNAPGSSKSSPDR